MPEREAVPTLIFCFFFLESFAPSSFIADNNLSSTIEQPFFADPALKIYVSAENEHPTQVVAQ